VVVAVVVSVVVLVLVVVVVTGGGIDVVVVVVVSVMVLVVVDVVVTGGKIDVVIVVVVIVSVDGFGPTALSTGSSRMMVWPFTTSVFGILVTVHEAHGGSVGVDPGTKTVLGSTNFQETVVFPSGPTEVPAT
jgi:hypothetical protein